MVGTSNKKAKVKKATTTTKVKKVKGTSQKPKKRVKRGDIIRKCYSSWLFFCKHNRERVTEAHKDLKHKEVFGVLSAEWRALDAAGRKPYEDMAHQDAERYERELLTLTEEQKKELKTIQRREKAKRKENRLVPGSPPAYILFSQEFREQVKKENPDANFEELGYLLGNKWKNLSEEDKKPYLDKARSLREAYQKKVMETLDKKKKKLM